ncbi:MAG: efflux RND transporter periplasmic adaptor subunit [Desulfobacteraceae bacterium]|nr:MAG: efflux RND transporter periplasmic adaptor subunit [Desulfobacteraceae bacterium]
MLNKKKIGKWMIIAVAALAAVWISVHLVMSGHTDSDLQITFVKPMNFDITVNTIGTLDAERSHVVSSTIKGDKGKIVYIIDEGTFVKNGEVLIKFDSAHFEAEMLRLDGEMRSREATVEARKQLLEWEKSQAEGAINTAEFDVKDAKQEYNRYVSYIGDMEELGRKGLHYPNEIFQAKKKAEQLFAKQQRHETLFEQIKKESVFKIAAAMAELSKAKNEIETTKIALDDIREELKKAVVHAPFPGIVVHYETHRDNQKRKPRVGDSVWQNQPLLYLPDISSMIVKTLVREVDLHKITKGQKASIQVDAYPKMIFTGQVTSIGVLASDGGEAGKGEKYFQVVVAIHGDNPNLRPGMTSRVILHTDAARNVLSVPVQAVFSEGANKYCYVGKGQSIKKVKVEIGRQNEDYAEIVVGLKNGDMVSLTKPAADEVKQ